MHVMKINYVFLALKVTVLLACQILFDLHSCKVLDLAYSNWKQQGRKGAYRKHDFIIILNEHVKKHFSD